MNNQTHKEDAPIYGLANIMGISLVSKGGERGLIYLIEYRIKMTTRSKDIISLPHFYKMIINANKRDLRDYDGRRDVN